MSPSTSTTASTPAPTFASLGVRTLINGRGTYTILTGSRVLPQVAEAMVQATNHYVHMDELMERVGERLAEVTGAPWGYVSSGCAAALTDGRRRCVAAQVDQQQPRAGVQRPHEHQRADACRDADERRQGEGTGVSAVPMDAPAPSRRAAFGSRCGLADSREHHVSSSARS